MRLSLWCMLLSTCWSVVCITSQPPQHMPDCAWAAHVLRLAGDWRCIGGDGVQLHCPSLPVSLLCQQRHFLSVEHSVQPKGFSSSQELLSVGVRASVHAWRRFVDSCCGRPAGAARADCGCHVGDCHPRPPFKTYPVPAAVPAAAQRSRLNSRSQHDLYFSY